MDTEVKQAPRSGLGARLVALTALSLFVSGVGYVGTQAYHAATDSFVAPIILSPDNDLILANKLKVSELFVERTKAVTRIEAIDADLVACNQALTRLRGLHATASNAVAWLESVNRQQMSATRVETSSLDHQRTVLAGMIDKQEALVREAQANLESGLISRTDYAREAQSLSQMKLAMLENERAREQSRLAVHQVSLAHKSLGARGGAVPMPELLVREDEVVRLELEILKLESDRRAKLAEKKAMEEKLAQIAALEADLKQRPIFRATERAMDVAFVPYTQIEGVREGAPVYDCVWGLFACRPVGTVAELVPGEVVLPDPWGNQARGQYAVLELREHESAKSKTLRVRGPSAPVSVARSDRSGAVSAR